MSGLGVDSSTLTLFQSLSGSSSDLLDTLYGLSGTSSANTDPLPALQSAETNKTADIAQTAADPQVTRDLAAFSAAIAAATTPAELLQNPAVLKVLLTANGLGDQVQYTALAQKALLSDPSVSTSLVNQLSDTNWAATAKTYLFATSGLSVIQTASVQQTLKSAYAEVLWRQSLDATTPGLSNAIDFRDRASTITSVDQILGDPTFRAVVTTALGIPEQIAFQDLGAQELSISSSLDVTKFADPKFVDAFTQRYLIAEQASAATSTADDSIASLASQSTGLVV